MMSTADVRNSLHPEKEGPGPAVDVEAGVKSQPQSIMASIHNDDERLLAQIGYKQVS